MTIKEKMKVSHIERYWKKQGRKDLFTWIHRYFRLHSELLENSVYQIMFDYHRNTLIEYYKRDVKRKNTGDKEYGELIDILADIYNQNNAERVNEYKLLVDQLYNFWKENPGMISEIRI